ncbi:MAG: hypothetical protein ACFE9L_15660 [Candidatus Hodarchaeota archaeon]
MLKVIRKKVQHHTFMILLIVFVIISQIRQLPSISRASFSFIYPTDAVISDTGTTHLIFRHTKYGSGYQYSDTNYNTYFHGNNSWELPIQISLNPTSFTILHVHPARNGFTIYYTYHGANSLLKREFNEFIGWGGETILFGIDEASTILESSSEDFERFSIIDFFFEDIESFIVIWSAFLTSNTNTSYFPTLLSRKSKGVISYNHDFYSLGLPYNPAYFNGFPYPYSGGRCGSFVTTNETLLYHYDYYYLKRISLFKNGSVTGWTDSESLDYMGYIPAAIDLIDNRFLLYQLEWDNVTELLTLAIRDLGSKEIAMKEFSLAINHSSLSDFSLDAGLASQTDTHVNFTIAIRTAISFNYGIMI